MLHPIRNYYCTKWGREVDVKIIPGTVKNRSEKVPIPYWQIFYYFKPEFWIRNDLFRIRIQLLIFRVPDPDRSSGYMRIRIQPLLFKYILKM